MIVVKTRSVWLVIGWVPTKAEVWAAVTETNELLNQVGDEKTVEVNGRYVFLILLCIVFE